MTPPHPCVAESCYGSKFLRMQPLSSGAPPRTNLFQNLPYEFAPLLLGFDRDLFLIMDKLQDVGH